MNLKTAVLAGLLLAFSQAGPVCAQEAVPRGRIEIVLANQYRSEEATIKAEFAEAGFPNVHIQFIRLGHPPQNLGLGREASAELARAAIRLALKYNQGIKVLLPEHLFPPRFATIASSNFDDTVEFPLDADALRQLQEPSLTTEQFHALYRRLTTGAAVPNINAHVVAMQKDAEDMVAHGGMGDAKAIVHHCAAITEHAEAILSALPPGDRHGQQAAEHLREAIRYCRKVAAFGDRVDPGVTLNPATKARAAVREAAKHLSIPGASR